MAVANRNGVQMSAKDKFDAAVKVIQSIPKNGPYQPSHETMLKFYSYYKQATLGPCNIGKPGFWDVIGKAKWDAWNKLGDMSKEEAMRKYVDELRQIVETMPQTAHVEEFVDKLGSFYESVDDGSLPAISKALVANGLKDRILGQRKVKAVPVLGHRDDGDGDATDGDVADDGDDGDGGTNGDSHQHPDDEDALHHSANNGGDVHVHHNGHHYHHNGSVNGHINGWSKPTNGVLPSGHVTAVDQSASSVDPVKRETDEVIRDDDADSVSSMSGSELEFCDTTDVPDARLNEDRTLVAQQGLVLGGGEQAGAALSTHLHSAASGASMASQRDAGRGQLVNRAVGQGQGGSGYGSSSGAGGNADEAVGYRSELNEQIAVTLLRLQQDMSNVLDRLTHLEDTLAHQGGHQSGAGAGAVAHRHQSPWWWPMPGVSGKAVAIILLWPFLAHWIIHVMKTRRARRLK